MFRPPDCPRCELPIGVYEPFAWQMPDGSSIDSRSVPLGTEVEEALDDRGTRVHRECVEKP
jgi:hypothetical protein